MASCHNVYVVGLQFGMQQNVPYFVPYSQTLHGLNQRGHAVIIDWSVRHASLITLLE